MKKADRIKEIEELLSSQDIKTQDELVKNLQEKNIDVTQATISRDIKEMGLVKVPAKSGGYRYSLPSGQKDKSYLSLILDIEVLDKMLSIKTGPGHAMLAKRNLLESYGRRIFSLVADDDSLLLVAYSEEDALIIYRLLGGE
ncbi:arginine repressor [Floricoccus penangensis]|uniref:Arginine repressor n=1 Tax=Floricoccus penangensis TaxID=1859475 RepID=A0A9Q5JIG5_9LACT|nr:hypothetical protein [Floricoccus penangensis]OFI47752.1 hypothetical protein BG262_08635 [Floricoccus penangensis]URZ88231.1 transcriptional regulator [Floricoccus penangensis]